MGDLDFLGPLAHSFETNDQHRLNLTLSTAESDMYYQLFFLKDNIVSKVEAELINLGLHEDIIEGKIYQLRREIDESEKMFYTDIAAIDWLDRINYDEASIVDHQIHQATLLIKDKDYVKTGRYLKRALELDPDAKLAYANQGVIALRRKNKKKALELFNTALRIDPYQVQALTYKMYILSSSRTATLKEFTAVVNQLLDLRPDHPSALKYKWHLVLHSQKLDEIVRYTKLNFKINYLEAEAMDELLNVLLWMTANEGRAFLVQFASELKGNLIKDVLTQFKERYEKLIAGLIISPDVILIEEMAEELEEIMRKKKKGK
jgi:tetratricopeptide (TPR) repeat protein